jgi:hypothetical protein
MLASVRSPDFREARDLPQKKPHGHRGAGAAEGRRDGTVRRGILIATALVSAFVAGSVASAAGGWRVFAKGTDTSDYYASASVDADAPKSQSLAIRGRSSSGRPVKLSFSLYCQGEKTAPSGRLLVVSVSAAKKCSFSAFGSLEGRGTVTVELLRR